MTYDMFLLNCPKYEDYLDTFVTLEDVRFIRKNRYYHMLVELGYRSPSQIYSPSEFKRRKNLLQESLWPSKKTNVCFSDNIEISDPVLKELALREKPNIQKNISTIIFVKSLQAGFEISGYIDYEYSLRRANLQLEDYTDWASIFQGKILMRPKPNHLSYFDWHSGIITHNNSDNYIVEHDMENGLTFLYKGDLRKVCVDLSRVIYSKNCTRTMVFSDIYGHVVFYDHVIRRKL